MPKHIVATALRTQRSVTIAAFGGGESNGEAGREAFAERAARLVAVDHGLVTGRLVVMLRAAPTRGAFEASLAAAAEPWRQRPARDLLESLSRWGDRAAGLARGLPSPLAGLRIRGWFGRQPLSYLFVRRVLEEWVSEGPGSRPVLPEIGHCLSHGVLAALPAVALPRIRVGAGVVRLVIDVTGGEDLTVRSPRRLRRPAGEHRRPPARVTWSFDFARKHYGPRVTEPPDAVVRLTAEDLALLAEAGPGWRGNRSVSLEGDEELAAALLDGIAAEPTPAGPPRQDWDRCS